MHLMLLLSMFLSEVSSLLPLNGQRIIQSKVKIRDANYQSNVSVFDKRKCVYYLKMSAFFSKQGCFFGQDHASGVFLNFGNERI